ncbi:F-box only protein 8 [Aplysia californica]|uniref:F-box only protein 8 n=1 Tax=Aplysia californica TaxID=6500 RepID=A0ABM0K3L3_APLCA|nr:F-box only protein 8 [Aplysia californica]
MGQVIRRLQDIGIRPQDYLGFPLADLGGWDDQPRFPAAPFGHREEEEDERDPNMSSGFPDLSQLPPELGLEVLRHLDATDLCLASCVWSHLANDELLWQSLCRSCWGSVTIYSRGRPEDFTYKQLFMALDEASLTFNTDPFQGIEYLTSRGILGDQPIEIARFLHTTKRLWPNKKLEFLQRRQDVLERLVQLQNFQNQFLPNALRKFFKEVSAPQERGNTLTIMLENFSQRFCACNPGLGLSKDAVFVLCFSLIMLSVDLCSPHVKNKMSKREFIKNTCRAVSELSGDLAGHMYDNIYLAGHVAPKDFS